MLAAQEGLLPVKVSAFYRQMVAAEVRTLGGHFGPLARVVLPDEERIGLRVGGEVSDFVADRSNMPDGGNALIRKYRDRLLFAPTSICAGHCLYCFRQDLLDDLHGREDHAFEARTEALRARLKVEPEVREVILSGGDPLTLPANALAGILETIKGFPHLRPARLHTRAPVFQPKSLSSAKIEALARYRVRIVLHVVHPYELCAEVEDLIGRLRAAGLRLYNQFPLLRGVNDHETVLARLLERLDELHVRNLSIFVPEPITGSATYRLAYDRILALWRQLNWSNPSWITATRLALDTPFGKVRPEDEIAREEGHILFRREGRTIRYPDFPQEHDRPGQVETLLWQG